MNPYTHDKIAYFLGLVRRWVLAISNNDFQTIKDTQEALTQFGAYYEDGRGWVYGEEEEDADASV